MPTPILVYGTARSGTTALTNLILSHENVVGLAHPLHWGAHEVPLHDYARYWGDLRQRDHYERFLSDLEGSDLWRLAEEETDWWRENPMPDVYTWFVTLMDRVAARRGCDFWVAKLDPKVVVRRRPWRRLRELLGERYADYAIVGARRPRAGVLASYLRMPGAAYQVRQGRVARVAASLLGLARYRLHDEYLDRLVEHDDALELTFAEIVGDPEELSRRLRHSIGDLGARRERSYPRNTSFGGAPGRRVRRGVAVGSAVWRLVAGVFDRVPALAALLVRAWELRPPGSNPLYYRLRRAAEDPEGLAAEFGRTGHEALLPHILPPREP